MRIIGNIIWVVFGGLELAVGWFIAGCLWCATIVGLPLGKQCFKFASLSLFPFGKEIVYSNATVSFLMNILWLIFGGLELAGGAALIGIFYSMTVVGIPFGLQFFKIAKLALSPFGAHVERVAYF